MNKSMRFERSSTQYSEDPEPRARGLCRLHDQDEREGGPDEDRRAERLSAELKGREFPIEESVVITGMQRTWQERGPHIFYTADLGTAAGISASFPSRR